MSDSVEASLPRPLIWAIAGCAVAVVGFVLPQLWWGSAAMQAAYDVPFISVGLVSLFAQRSLIGSTHAVRLKVAAYVAGTVAFLVGTAAYWLYGFKRPELLAERLHDLASEAALHGVPATFWLDARAQALQIATSVLLVGFVVGTFVAFRARVAQRHGLR
jgi:hypothetical protein